MEISFKKKAIIRKHQQTIACLQNAQALAETEIQRIRNEILDLLLGDAGNEPGARLIEMSQIRAIHGPELSM